MNTSNQKSNRTPSSPENAPTFIEAQDGSATGLVRVLDQYMEDLQAGKAPNHDELIGQYPELAPQLQECLGGIEFIHQTSHAPEDTPSQLGDFRIEREIGRGGMGVVYEATQVSLNRRVALKVLRFGGVADKEAVERFQREAETVAGLDHANIVPVYAVGTEGGVHYYAMQFIEGQSLAAVSSRRQSSTEAAVGRHEHSEAPRTADAIVAPRTTSTQIATWGLQAARALSHAHQNGVVHRDVKPSNLILDDDGQLWLTDFGLARRDIDTTLSVAGALLGTPRYMSPEQAAAAKKPVDHRTDIYSLGATLYELATGKPVFDADTPQGVITQILTVEPPAPRNLDPNLPRDLETIILKCLQKTAADRYATSADLADDLQALLEDRPIQARRPTLIERGTQLLRRHRRVASAAGLSAAVAVVMLIGVWLVPQFYAESRMGEVGFVATGPRMIGEILNDNGETVVSDFPVPTIEKLKLPEGDYTLRLAANGLLSEDWPLEIVRGESMSHSVQFRSRWLWPPKELPSENYREIEVAALTDAGSDIFILSHETDGTQANYQMRLACIDGRTGKSSWTDDFVTNTTNSPVKGASNEWAMHLRYAGAMGSDQGRNRLLRPLSDLNGDGIRDPVWLSRTHPSLLALSGADGSVLWWFRSNPRDPDGNPLPDSAGRRGAVVSRPAIADVDGDGTADIVACFCSSAAQTWLESVSGRTGESLWRCTIEAGFEKALSSSNDSRKAHSAGRVNIALIEGRRVAVTTGNQKLFGVDLTTGKVAWEPHELGFDQFRSPVCRDLNDDGSDDILLTGKNDRDDSPRFVAVDLVAVTENRSAKATIWERRFRPANSERDVRRDRSDWCIIDDFSKDGSTRIVFPTGHFEHSFDVMTNERWAGVEMIDGSSSATIWTRRLTVTNGNQPNAVDRIITGPDLNGDGFREVVASWIGPAGPGFGTAIHVAALSGKDGSTLWRWRDFVARTHFNNESGGPLNWWQPGSDGWPLLVVPMEHARGGQQMTYFLSASDGQLQHTLTEAREANVADFNGDGIVDLFYKVSPQGAPRMLVIQGTSPEPWKRIGEWRPIDDVNGDGHSDFLKRHQMTVASGQDGRILWNVPQRLNQSGNTKPQITPPMPHGDLDGDGIADLFRFESLRDGSGATIGGYSGKDGRRVWLGEGLIELNGSGSGGINGWHYQIPKLDWADINHDGTADILAVTMQSDASSHNRWLLSAWSGTDGSLMWQVPVMRGTVGGTPDPYGREYPDLNGDGVGDPVIWMPVREQKANTSMAIVPGDESPGNSTRDVRESDSTESGERFELRAIDGTNGSTLWGAPEFSVQKERQLLWPRPAIGDLDGDGIHEVVVLTHGDMDRSRNGYRNELLVLNGQDGTKKWSHSWYGNFDVLPPLLVDFDGDGTRTVCVGVHENSKYAILLLDADGVERDRITLQARRGFEQQLHLWFAADIDGDNREELLFDRDGELTVAHGSADSVVWSWPLPDQKYSTLLIEDIRAREREVVVWSGDTVYGLNASDGRTRWRCKGTQRPSIYSSQPPGISLLNTADPLAPPGVLFHGPSFSQDFATIVQQATAVADNGHLEIAASKTREYEPLGEEPQAMRQLPWMSPRKPSLYQHLESLLIPSGLTMVLIIMIPVWLIRATLRSSRASIATFPMLVLCAGAAIGTLGPFFPQAATTAVALILPVLLLIRFAKRRAVADAGLAAAAMILLVAPLVILHYSPAHVFSEFHQWGAWFWLDEFLFEPLMVGLVAGLPGYFYWTLLARSARCSQWKQVRHLFTWATILAAVLAVLIPLLDSQFNLAQVHYTWNGWYIIWFWGAFVVGAIMLLRRCIEWVAAMVKGRSGIQLLAGRSS
jgi:serine/threonine protein kinase